MLLRMVIKTNEIAQHSVRIYVILTVFLLQSTQSFAQQAAEFDSAMAFEISQAAIGTKLSDLNFTDTEGMTVRLADYYNKPLLISLVFTACHLTCPVTTKQLKSAVTAAHDALGENSFNVITIGFDTQRDTPQNMRTFAQQQNINIRNWSFLSGSQASIDALTNQLGFSYFTSPRGFDHLTQVSIVDQQGVIYQQVYGEVFELPWLVEPLKELVFNKPAAQRHLFSDFIAKVKIFCTVYNPNTGRYRFDYSLFIQILIGLFVVLSVGVYLYRESKHLNSSKG